jgi:RNA polymerase sigma-70 factor (ECF subfamily)
MTDVATRSQAKDFADFYAIHFHPVARQLYAYLGDRAEAQDAAQEAFCRAYDRWERIGAYDDSLAWVRRVAWNLATSRLRHLRAAARYALRQREEVVEGPGPDRVTLVRALSTLPPKHRLAVVLHHLADVSIAEIAEQHGVAEGTVKSWLARGRSRLADYFAGDVLTRPPLPAFTPAGLGAVAAKAKRRRAVRRSAVAAVLAIVITVPVALMVRAQGTEPPIIEPTPQPSPSVPPTPNKTIGVGEGKRREWITFA